MKENLSCITWSKTARGIGLYVNSEFICFHRDTAMFTPKLVDQFTFLSSSISSTESNGNIHLEKEDYGQFIDHMEI